jgi:hypothetical protein
MLLFSSESFILLSCPPNNVEIIIVWGTAGRGLRRWDSISGSKTTIFNVDFPVFFALPSSVILCKCRVYPAAPWFGP